MLAKKMLDRTLEATEAKDHVILSTWMSPAFPIGQFAYSHGLETVIVSGAIRDEASLAGWVGGLIEHGSGWCDAVFLAEAWQATSEGDFGRLAEASALALAFAPSAERLLETRSLGAAFLNAVSAGWPHTKVDGFASIDPAPAYPIALGVAAAAHELPSDLVMASFLNSFAANLISVAVRLVPLGQTSGLQVLGQLQSLILETAERAAKSTLDDLGSAAIQSDIVAMRHETLQSRIFRS
jgi:urease accessory protein